MRSQKITSGHFEPLRRFCFKAKSCYTCCTTELYLCWRPCNILKYVQSGADTGFSSGGDKSGAKRPKNFVPPPLSSSGGGKGGGDRIQEDGENQVTYQSIGIWMFWIRIHTQMFDTTNNLPSSMTSKQRYMILRAPVCACGLYHGSCFSYIFRFF